jgi:hypothetical protein
LPNRSFADPEGLGDLSSTLSVDRTSQESFALPLRKRSETNECLADQSTLLELRVWPFVGTERPLELVVIEAGLFGGVDDGRLGDPKEPGFEATHLGATAKRRPCLQQHLLNRILSI